jgi:hypothetical protein
MAFRGGFHALAYCPRLPHPASPVCGNHDVAFCIPQLQAQTEKLWKWLHICFEMMACLLAGDLVLTESLTLPATEQLSFLEE